MGNEGSLPQEEEDVDEQLEHQAKAPPSATNPPHPSQLANGIHGQHQLQQQQQSQVLSGGGTTGSGGGKGRLMGSVFTRRGNAHNQNSTGIERTVEVAASYPPSHYNVNNNINHNNNNASVSGVVPMPGEELTYMNPDPNANYYHHHHQPQGYDAKMHGHGHGHPQHLGGPQPPQQPMYIQQQHYNQQLMQPQHVMPNQQYYQQQQSLQTSTLEEDHRDQRVVGVMYSHQDRNRQANSNAPSSSSTATAVAAASALGKKSRRAGAGLISSMRNLSLGFGGGNSLISPSRSSEARQQVNEWETRWYEDDDEEEEEDEDGVDREDIQYSQSNQTQTPPPPPLHPQMRPDMDSGYASAAAAVGPILSSGPPYSQQQLNQLPLISPQPGEISQLQHQQQSSYTPTHLAQKTHLVTATPGTPGIIGPPLADDDGVEWDTGTQQHEIQQFSDKPTVEQFLPLLRVLGKGSFGKVVLVQKRVGRETGSLFAMKILRKSHLVRRRQIERTRTERKVLSVVNHPFIMKLHYAFQSPDKLYLVLDYCPGGELFFHLSRFRRFPERVARFYSAELLLALGHLHKRGIIYRDLKPENVLLDAEGHVKLGDFGLAKAGIRHAYEGATSMCGTPEYMAPEVLAQQGHGFCVDYWGLGMLTYEMMTGLPPWYTTDRAKLFRRLRSAPLDIPPYFSSASASFSSALLERNPKRRLGVTGIRAAMEHEFFKSISWRALYGRRVEAPIRPCEGWTPPDPSNDIGKSPQESCNTEPDASGNLSQLNGNNNINPGDLDAATANFDNQFTRMPVETEDNGNPDEEDGDLEELHEDTFVGFTFDDNDRDELEAAQQQQQQQRSQQQQTHLRNRTHHFDTGVNDGNQTQHQLD